MGGQDLSSCVRLWLSENEAVEPCADPLGELNSTLVLQGHTCVTAQDELRAVFAVLIEEACAWLGVSTWTAEKEPTVIKEVVDPIFRKWATLIDQLCIQCKEFGSSQR